MRLKFYLLLFISLCGVFFASDYILAADGDCTASVSFSVILKNVDGTGASKLKVEVYQQDYDNGNNKKPIVGKKVSSGTTDSNGKLELKFVPVSGKRYIVKVYENSADNGDFWYFDQQPYCGGSFEFKKTLPRVTIILRDYKNNLIKDSDVSLYSLHNDVDGSPVIDKAYLVSTAKPSTQGKLSFYVSGNISELKDKTGAYVLQIKRNNQLFNFVNIRPGNIDVTYEYILSGFDLSVNLANGKPSADTTVNIYKQNSDLSLGAKLYSTKTNAAGKVSFEYPAGVYAFSVTDSFKQESVFNNVVLSGSGVNTKTLTLNYTKFYLASVSADSKGSAKRSFQLYSLIASEDKYYKNKLVGSLSVSSGIDTPVVLATGPYLAVHKVGNQEYGTAFMVTNNDLRIGLKVDSSSVVSSDSAITITTANNVVTTPSKNTTTTTKATATKTVNSKLKGYIVSVNNNGGLWYISKDSKRFRLDNNDTLSIIKSLSVGISNNDINKIPLGFSGVAGLDTDKDGLNDSLELALGTNISKADSDGDKFSDLVELKNNYNPLAKGKLKIDKVFANKQKGRLFTQVQSQGQFWYISPKDGKRYLLESDNMISVLSKIAVSVSWPEIAYLTAGN